jgi:hypothetical protein
LTIVITCELAESAMEVTGPTDTVEAGLDAVAFLDGVGDGLGDAVVRLGLGAAVVVVTARADVVRAAGLVAVDPSAAFRVPSGPVVVSQAAAERAATTASTDSRTVRAVRRLGVRLLRSMDRRP